MLKSFDSDIQSISAFYVNILIVFLTVSLHQEVHEKLYNGECNAVVLVSFERLKCAHRSAQKLCQLLTEKVSYHQQCAHIKN